MTLFHARLIKNLVAGGLLLAAIAYDWLGNMAHEVIGTAMFGLLIAHNIFNRRWYGAVAGGRRDARRWINTITIFTLLVVMLVLLTTSLLISRSVFDFVPLNGGFTARQIHGLVGYWALVIVSLHLGTRWMLIMATTRNLLGVTRPNKARAWLLRAIAAVLAGYGVNSASVIGLRSKLTAEMTIAYWNFEDAALTFFFHLLSIIGLFAAVGHFGMMAVQSSSKKT